MRCHNVTDEELVNVGGHRLGGADFEMVSWSQGLMRHRFISGGGERNAPNTNQRLAMIFVSGMIADLEFSLRATANATTNGDFGKQSAQRALTAAKRLASVYQKAPLPELKQIIEAFQNVQLKTNNKAALTLAADSIRAQGLRFGANRDGSQLVNAIGEYIPKPSQWVFE